MPVIYSRNFADGTRNYLSLNNGDYVRTMSIGSNWNRIRIGILCALGTVNENAWNIRSGILGLGVCNGASSCGSAQAPAHQIGYWLPTAANNSGPNAWTYNAGSSGNSYFSLGNWTFAKWAAGSLTTAAVGSLTVNIASNTTLGGALARRSLLILDISKSALVSGNITQGVAACAAGHMTLDITSTDMFMALESVSTVATVQGTALSNLALGNSIAFNETTNGALDEVFVYWNLYTVPFQLYQIAVYRVG